MTTERVSRRNLTDELAARLAADIRSGAIAPEARLPTEAQLSRSFGVSRTVVREAISRLRSEGLVAARQGAGVFVLRSSPDRPFRIQALVPDSVEDMIRLTEFRMAFESGAAALAAQRRSALQLRRMRAAIAAMAEAVAEGAPGDAADMAFHRGICEATGNPHYIAFFAFLEPHMAGAVRRSRERSLRVPGLSARVLAEHEAVLGAIADRDPDRAAAAARRHVEGTMERLAPERTRRSAA
jgi:GntR family transcriptional repressor for pyruvate dehydrogenase complex